MSTREGQAKDDHLADGKQVSMSNPSYIAPLQTVTLTVLGGVLVFVVGQILVKFLIEPLHEFRKVVGEIAFAFTYYSNVLLNPPVNLHDERHQRATDEVRRLAAKLAATAHGIPFYGFFALLRIMPSRSKMKAAARDLIEISNCASQSNLAVVANSILSVCTALRIQTDRKPRKVIW